MLSPALSQVLKEIRSRSPRGATRLVAIDGRGGSGKSRLADTLAAEDPSMKVLRVDHFPCVPDEYPLHPSGVQTRISQVRLVAVLLPLTVGEPATYRRTYWGTTERGARGHRIEAGGTVLVEGCYSLLPSLRPLYDFSIWAECSPERALARAKAREGISPDHRGAWEFGHLPNQERYIATHRPSEFADLILDTNDGTDGVLRPGA